MDSVPVGNDARIMTTLDIDLDSQDPALVEKLAVLKPLLRDILQIVRDSAPDLVSNSGTYNAVEASFSKVLRAGGFHKVTYAEIVSK